LVDLPPFYILCQPPTDQQDLPAARWRWRFSNLEKIKEAFSVEKVTTKFFDEFRRIFDRTRKEFEEANKNTVCLWLRSKYEDEDYKEQVNKFVFTFLGRIIFLYFLLRKGWIEDKKNYIRSIFEDKSNTNLYKSVLEPLFFEVFAKQEKDRSPTIKEQFKNTPYLNGGLFEHSDLETEMVKGRQVYPVPGRILTRYYPELL